MKFRKFLVILTTALICSAQIVPAVSAAEVTAYEEGTQEDVTVLSGDTGIQDIAAEEEEEGAVAVQEYYSKSNVQTGGTWTNDGTSYKLSDGTYWKGWIKSDSGYYYTDSSGNLVTGWKKIDGDWYYFYTASNAKQNSKYIKGLMATNVWLQSNGKRYYLTSAGEMATGWRKINNKWYYLNLSSGAMQTGWQKISGNWYYFNDSGVMQTGWQQLSWSGGTDYFYFKSSGELAVSTTIDGYTVDSNGVRKGTSSGTSSVTSSETANGWVQKDGTWFYYEEGTLRTGWLKSASSGKWYYLSKVSGDGHMLTEWGTIDGKKYYFGTDGAMRTGWQKISGKWYYFVSSGAMQTGWKQITWNGSKSWFYFDQDGVMQTGWQKINGSWYYLESNGKMATGWIQLGSDWYYLKSDGSMAADETVDGKYYVDSNGRWTGSTSSAAYSPAAGSVEAYITNSKTAKKTTQIILVNGHNLSLWNKKDGRWTEQFDAYCGYGRNGMIAAEEHSEGTSATPIGSYPIMFAFGKASNPGTSMTYRNVTSNSYWSDEKSTYNTWVESSTYVSGEHLTDYYQYKYAMAIGFNQDPIVYGRGSAIFLHCKSTNTWGTGGCVSVKESVMVKLLKACKNGTYIIIVPDKESIANY